MSSLASSFNRSSSSLWIIRIQVSIVVPTLFEFLTDLLLHRQKLHLEVILMQAALSLLLARPSTSTFASVAITTLDGRVPVTDTFIPLRKENVAGNVVLVNVRLDLGERPREERVDFDESGRVDFHGLKTRAISTLGGSSTCDDGLDI